MVMLTVAGFFISLGHEKTEEDQDKDKETCC
jgi:hypothetical protein